MKNLYWCYMFNIPEEINRGQQQDLHACHVTNIKTRMRQQFFNSCSSSKQHKTAVFILMLTSSFTVQFVSYRRSSGHTELYSQSSVQSVKWLSRFVRPHLLFTMLWQGENKRKQHIFYRHRLLFTVILFTFKSYKNIKVRCPVLKVTKCRILF